MCPIFNGCGNTAVWSWRVQIRCARKSETDDRHPELWVTCDCSCNLQLQLDALWYCLVVFGSVSNKKAKTTSGELHLLLPRGLKSALKSMVGFLNTYFELLQFTEIIYVTNKCNQYVICLSFIPSVRLFMRNIQTAVSTHPLKIGHMFMWTYLFRIVHTTTS